MPTDFIASPLTQTFALILILDGIKTLFLGTLTSINRLKVKQFTNQEDADMIGGEAITYDHPVPGRIQRAHRNNLENLLSFYIFGTLFILSGANTIAGITYFVAYFSGRTVHTWAYLCKRPLLRRNAYALAWLSQIIMGLHAAMLILIMFIK